MVTGTEMEEACSRPASARLCDRRGRSKCSEWKGGQRPWELGERRTSDTGGGVWGLQLFSVLVHLSIWHLLSVRQEVTKFLL